MPCWLQNFTSKILPFNSFINKPDNVTYGVADLGRRVCLMSDKSPASNKAPQPVETPTSRQWPEKVDDVRKLWEIPRYRKITKVAIGFCLVVGFGFAPARSMLLPSSTEAVLNRRIITVRSPIEGQLTISSQGKDTVITVSNPRADRTRLADLEGQLTRNQRSIPILRDKIEDHTSMLSRLEDQSENFRQGRIRQLTARRAELEANVRAASARREEANAAYERSSALAKTGNISNAEMGRLMRERTITAQNEISSEQQLAAAHVELDAARRGVFIGDSYNDRPSSTQAADELRRRLNELHAELKTTQSLQDRLETELEDERARFSERSKVTLNTPQNTRIWESLVTSGEHVRNGQDLLRTMDCNSAIITASVSERIYNKLSVGDGARFIPADGGAETRGFIADMSGAASIAGNLAVPPLVIDRRDQFRVNVELMVVGDACNVGRTGQVIFEPKPR